MTNHQKPADKRRKMSDSNGSEGTQAAAPDPLLKTTVGKITCLVGSAFSEDSAASGTALIGVYVSFDSLVDYRSNQHISGVDQQHDRNMIPPYKGKFVREGNEKGKRDRLFSRKISGK